MIRKGIAVAVVFLLMLNAMFATDLATGQTEITLSLKNGTGDDDNPVLTPSYKVGFTNESSVTAETDMAGKTVDEVVLTDDTADAQLIATGSVNMFYQIISSDPVHVKITGEALASTGTAGVENNGNTIDWDAEFTPKTNASSSTKTSFGYSDGAKNYATGSVIFTHNPKATGATVGSSGVIPVTFTTLDASSKIIDDYTATIILTVVDGLPS